MQCACREVGLAQGDQTSQVLDLYREVFVVGKQIIIR